MEINFIFINIYYQVKSVSIIWLKSIFWILSISTFLSSWFSIYLCTKISTPKNKAIADKPNIEQPKTGAWKTITYRSMIKDQTLFFCFTTKTISDNKYHYKQLTLYEFYLWLNLIFTGMQFKQNVKACYSWEVEKPAYFHI